MKIRNGFVSNSSSSSFIVFGNTPFSKAHIPEAAFEVYNTGDYEITLPDRNACYEFGWEHIKYYSVMDKLNFAVIQANYMESNPHIYKTWMERITSTIRKDFAETHPGKKLNIVFDFETHGWDYPYIDHQSASYEGENTEMFDSEERMENFLFNEGTYIQGGNDNE